jgi:hypothetical protein
MGRCNRVLDLTTVDTLADHERQTGGRALAAARAAGPLAVLDAVEASGLRGRGHAGRAAAAPAFPIVPLRDIADGSAVLDLDQLEVAPDWTVGDGSGASPADRLDVRSRS